MKKLAAMFIGLIALAAATPVVAMAKDGADDPPQVQVQVEDAPNHG